MRVIKSDRKRLRPGRNVPKSNAWFLDRDGHLGTGERRFLKGVVVVKVTVMVGIVASYFVPNEHAMVVGIASNMLWLWKT